MFDALPKTIAKLAQNDGFQDLIKMRHGVEKESLRIDQAGYLSQKPHPRALGSAFTHGEITTDFSESLLEFITPPSKNLRDAIADLTRIHQFTVMNLEDEILWPCSMPCVLTEDDEIPLANYGKSNLARLKTLYRAGLGRRYGRAMQTIAGVHYNLSFDEDFIKRIWQQLGKADSKDVVSDAYFGLIRNYYRVSWMVPYLFGASPAVCQSFFAHEPDRFPLTDKGQYANPYAASLRLSDLGYKNRTHGKMHISYDNLDAYVASLKQALLTKDPEFDAMGVKVGDEWLQLNAHILQIEAEYYGSVRPKRIPYALERTVHALGSRGVEYIEVRTLDLYPFSPIGVDERALRFLDILLLSCFLTDSPIISIEEQAQIEENHRRAVNEGRRPGLMLLHNEDEVRLTELGMMHLNNMQASAEILDKVFQTHEFQAAWVEAKGRFIDSAHLPSSRLLDRMAEEEGSFFKTSMALAREHFQTLKAMPLSPEVTAEMVSQATASWQRHEAIDLLPEPPFEQFMAQYFDPKRL